MDTITFISNLVRDLAWPVVTFCLVMAGFWKAPTLARFVKAIRYKDVEVTLIEDFLSARADVQKLKLAKVESYSEEISPNDKVVRLAEIDPGIAIFEIWRNLESEVIRLIQHNGLRRFTTPVEFVGYLGKLGRLSNEEVALFRKLLSIRNTLVHAPDALRPTLAEVLEFKDFVEVLSVRLDQIRREPGYIDLPRDKSAKDGSAHGN